MVTQKQKRFLKARAHSLKPVVIVGDAGLSEGVLREIDLALEHHELIKVRVNAEDRDARAGMIATMCEHCTAEAVQQIGHIAVLYRRARKPRLLLPTE